MFLFAAMAAISAPVQEAWYGPATVSFELAVTGSPYDGQSNDVRVEFVSGRQKETRLAYFDGTRWRATLLAPRAGTYEATVLANGRPVKKLVDRAAATQAFKPAFVRIAPDRRHFVTGDGKPYWPMGHNLGWQDNRIELKLTEQLAEMGRSGANWARIWACSWDGKNPFYSEGVPSAKGRDLLLPAIQKWDAIVEAAGMAGVRFQFVLFHHGMFSTKTDANWNINSWNVANGGFLAKPEDFFTDPEAIARAKNWLRYAVARWGHDPAIMAWELFNEVEWVDAFSAGKGEEVGRWHDLMADYLRSIDPYQHLVTTSSGRELPIWRKADYYQPHGYPPDIRALVLGTAPTTDRPLFFGEVGLGGGPRGAEAERQAVRSALWSGLMAGHAGSAQYWYWDRVVTDGLYPEFAKFSKFVSEHRLAEGIAFEPTAIEVSSRQAGAITFAPGQGWAKTTRFVYQMPRDAANGALGSLSGFIQGPDKKDMMAEPIRFEFETAQAGRFEVSVGTIARAGAEVRLLLDGQPKVSEKFDARDRDRPLNRTFGFDFGPGKHTVTVANPGPDWYVVDSVKIDGLGRAVEGNAATDGHRTLLRLSNRAGTAEEAFSLSGALFKDGAYQLDRLDLDSGKTDRTTVRATAGKLMGELEAKDAIVLLTPK